MLARWVGSVFNATRMALLYALWLTGLVLCACTDSDTPEQRVRAVIAAMQTAAEARDTGDFMNFIASDFRNPEGQGFDDVQRLVRGYLLTHQSVYLLTRIEELDFPVAGEAQVDLTVGTAGKPMGTGSGWDLAADVHHLKLVLREQDGDWKVIHASWRH